jgi:hypothetical protein
MTMPTNVYTQRQNHSAMAKSNTSLPRVSDSPLPSPTLSQASTHVDPRSITDPDDERNPANNVNFPVDGWPTLARIIATKPDLEAFASFTDLGIKSLLYYQAELIYLRKKLHEEEWKDFRTDDIEKSSKYADNLEALILGREASIESKEKDNENSLPLPRQWVLIERIRATLKEYSKRFQNAQENMTDLVTLNRFCTVGILTSCGTQGRRKLQCQPSDEQLCCKGWQRVHGPHGDRCLCLGRLQPIRRREETTTGSVPGSLHKLLPRRQAQRGS